MVCFLLITYFIILSALSGIHVLLIIIVIMLEIKYLLVNVYNMIS